MSANNIPEVTPPLTETAVSVYGSGDAMDDFPVLKAFQQYVDAEHAKAQKRLTTLCIFFAVLMVVVISVFVMMLMSLSQRSNALGDQLMQYLLKERDRQNVIVTPGAAPSQSDATMRAMADSLATMQKQMLEQQTRLADQQMKLAEQTVRQAAARAAAASEEPVGESERADFTAQKRAHAKLVKSETEKLRRVKAALDLERKRLAQEKALLKEKEVDLQRRKLYPEYYAAQVAADGKPPAAQAPASPAADTDDEDLADIDAALESESHKVERADGSIRYFEEPDEDHASVRVETEGKTSAWSIPLE